MTDLRFPTMYEFVDQIILPYYGVSSARINSTNWSARWWAHSEVVARLEALWLRFETLRQEEPATYMESFFRLHADYHMRWLMGESCVLQDCRREDTPTMPLPTSPVETTYSEV